MGGGLGQITLGKAARIVVVFFISGATDFEGLASLLCSPVFFFFHSFFMYSDADRIEI